MLVTLIGLSSFAFANTTEDENSNRKNTQPEVQSVKKTQTKCTKDNETLVIKKIAIENDPAAQAECENRSDFYFWIASGVNTFTRYKMEWIWDRFLQKCIEQVGPVGMSDDIN